MSTSKWDVTFLVYRQKGQVTPYYDEFTIKVNPDERVAVISSLKNDGVSFEEIGDRIHVFHIEDNKSIQDLVNLPDRLVQRPSTLEDVFFRLTGRSLLE